MNQIKIFIGCSSEGILIAEAIRAKFKDKFFCQIWNDEIIELSRNTFDEILRNIRESDFCLFIFTADDELISRSKKQFAPRDNVVLEAGISFGILDKERTFIIKTHKDIKIPTDLSGFNIGYIEPNSVNLIASVGPVCNIISQKINSIKRKKKITIALSGAQGVGKSTTIRDLNKALSKESGLTVRVNREVARDLIKKGIGGDQNTKPEDYALYINRYLEYYSISDYCEIKLLDRTILDVLAFANVNVNIHDNWIKMLSSLVELMIKEIDYYFYIPIQSEVPLMNDNIRNVDNDYRDKIDAELVRLLDYFYPIYIEVRGNKQERMESILDCIGLKNKNI